MFTLAAVEAVPVTVADVPVSGTRFDAAVAPRASCSHSGGSMPLVPGHCVPRIARRFTVTPTGRLPVVAGIVTDWLPVVGVKVALGAWVGRLAT